MVGIVNRVSPTCAPTSEMTDHKRLDEQLQQTMPQRMGNSFRKFLLLIWKNTYVIRKRHWLVTICEIIIPSFLFLLMAIVRASTGAFGVEYIQEPTYFLEVSESEMLNNLAPGTSINYAPTNNCTMNLVTRLSINCNLHNQASNGFASEEALINHYNKLTLNKTYTPHDFVAIIFEGEAAKNCHGSVPDKLQYKFRLSTTHRLYTDELFSFMQLAGPVAYNDDYLTSSFTPLQVCLDKAFIELTQAKFGQPVEKLKDEVFTQKMPYPPYLQDSGYTSVARYLLPTLANFSFITLCIAVIKRVVEEKQTGARELMRLMGMEGWAMWTSWLVDALLVRLVTLAIVVVLLKVEMEHDTGAVLRYSDGSVLYFMLLVYTIAAVCSCFFVTTFFSRPTLAVSVGAVLWILSQSLPSYIAEAHVLSNHSKRAFMLLPNMGLYYLFHVAIDFEARGTGAQWSNFFESGTGAPNGLSLAGVCMMFIISSVLYLLLTWYVSSISPGEFGVAEPWHFIFSRNYWMPTDRYTRDAFPDWDSDSEQGRNFERPLSKNLNEPDIGVYIRDLTKAYKSALGKQPVKAVRGLSLDLYKGEVTALLGHNGAGKTTTMSILTGMIGASGGSVKVLGHNLATELAAVRTSLGLCPQHNMLFKDLTVREHLIFFAMMKGNTYKAAAKEAAELVEQVQLKDKWNKQASTLSGGMKRKLSLAIALIGGSKVLMLDEPTSGLDPEARREIWDLLLGMRGQRIILLSTHFMEEADVLGDTIAIMAHGKVHCCGSSLYLKRLYGAGYHLTVLRKPNCDVESVSNLVMAAVPEAEMTGSKNDQTDGRGQCPTGPITFRLPSDSTHKFADMLDKLESSRDQLGIFNVSMSVTTMEEVFIKVGELVDEAKAEEDAANFDQPDCAPTTDSGCAVSVKPDPERNNSLQALNPEKNNGERLMLQQFWALIRKKCIFTLRNWMQLIFQVAIPLLLMLATISLSVSSNQVESNSYPSLSLSLNAYGKPKDLRVLYSASAGVQAKNASDAYGRLVKGMASVRKVQLSEGGVLRGLLSEAVEGEAVYRQRYIAAASFNETPEASLRATAIFSSNALHASPISMNLLTNSLLAYKTGSSKYRIDVSNHPLPTETTYQQLNHYQTASLAAAMIWLSIAPLGWLFAVASALMLPLQERVCGARQLQVMSGVSYWMVWLSYLLVDVAINTIIALFAIIIVPIFDTNQTYSGSTELGVMFLLIFLYGISGTAFTYVMSFFKNSPAGAYSVLVVINILVGLVVNFAVYVLELLENNNRDTALLLRNLFGLLLPHSAFTSAFAHFGATATYNAQCQNMPASMKNFVCNQGIHHALEAVGAEAIACCENLCRQFDACFKPVPYLAWHGTREGSIVEQNGPILREVVFLTLGITWLVLALLLDSGMLARAKESVLRYIEARLHPQDEVDSLPMDEDVQQECSRVSQTYSTNTQTEDILAVRGLVKDFGAPIRHSRFHAVRGITFAVKPGECFGLLGVNGAGKTTTFRMLTGAEVPTHGDASLRNVHLQRDRRRYLSDLGYCPQFDAQLGVLTGRETLALYANLRGLPSYKIDSEINKWFDLLGLTEYGSRATSSYSGGNRRKLSAAMALIGEPPLVLLDEPTSGVDPIARRRLWHVLTRCQQSGQAIVLTSHSMDECEALCNRLGIMVAGQLKCLGPISYLKQKFGQGFTVMMKVRTASWAATQDYLQETGLALRKLQQDVVERLHPCTLQDQHQGMLHYHVTDPTKRWSELFSVMEELKQKHSGTLEDYTISETTLEQVFLSFARDTAVACADMNEST